MNPYRQAREVENDALARMTGPSPGEVGWGEGYVAGAAAKQAEIVKLLREAAHGGNRGQPGSFWVGWRAAARAIEGGWTEKPETDT